MKIFKSALLVLLISFLFACEALLNKNKPNVEAEVYFEGEIKLSESRGLYGSLTKIHTNWWISENIIKREQRLGGLNAIFNAYAGIIVNIEKDSVTLYFADFTTKSKHTLSVADYKRRLGGQEIQMMTPSPIDLTFDFLGAYNSEKHVKDSMDIKGFTSDYTLYLDDLLQQEVFDTKEIKVKRELLEMVFHKLPADINFPLKSAIKTILSRIKNDTLINNPIVADLDKISRNILHEIDTSNKQEPTDLKKLSENKALNLGLDIFKKGVDLKIHFENELSEIDFREIEHEELDLPSGNFKSFDDFDDFYYSIPSGNGDFDD